MIEELRTTLRELIAYAKAMREMMRDMDHAIAERKRVEAQPDADLEITWRCRPRPDEEPEDSVVEVFYPRPRPLRREVCAHCLELKLCSDVAIASNEPAGPGYVYPEGARWRLPLCGGCKDSAGDGRVGLVLD